MKKRVLSVVVASMSLFVGCGGGGSDDSSSVSRTLHKLSNQSGAESYLFYGDVNAKSLGSFG